MAWVYLTGAAIFEIIFASSMKAAHGFSKLGPSVLVVIAGLGSIYCLTVAIRDLPISVAYPIWVGTGAVGSVLIGYLAFGESMEPIKLVSVGLITLGIIGLKVVAS